MGLSFARSVMLAAPSVAMAVVGLALLGPGAARSFEGAEVWGGPTEGRARLSLRVAVLRRFRSIDSVVAGRSVVVRSANGEGASDRCTTDADGRCDVELRLAAPPSSSLRVSVVATTTAPDQRSAAVQELAAGTLARVARGWGERPARRPELSGSRQGDLVVHAYALRGVLAAPFPETLAVLVTDQQGDPRGGAEITASLEGGDVEVVRQSLPARPAQGGTAVTRSDDRGRAELKVVPRSHVAELNLTATTDGATGSFTGTLPVIAGAIWLDPGSRSSGQLRILAPIARPSVYAVLATRSARWWGGTIALTMDAQGFFGASVPWPAVNLPAGEEAWLTLAGDPEGRGPGTVGWPVAAADDRWGAAEQVFNDALLLDGMPDAERRETERRERASWLVAIALGATACLEAVLIVGGARPRGSSAWGRVAAAVAAIVLAFAAIGIVAMWKAAG